MTAAESERAGVAVLIVGWLREQARTMFASDPMGSVQAARLALLVAKWAGAGDVAHAQAPVELLADYVEPAEAAPVKRMTYAGEMPEEMSDEGPV